MTERDKLLPCPFCGSEPRHLEHKAGFYRERVICDSCEFHLPPEAWNLRALAAQQPVDEPVAYMIWAPFTGPAQFTTDKTAPIKTAQRADYTCTPLYAHTSDFKDAYVGAREDLEVWKRRALAAEENNRQLLRALGEEVNSPIFLGEPSGVHFADHPNLDKANPQASAPADHTARGMQGQTGPVATPYIPTDHTAEVIATPPYFCSDGDRCHNLLNEALCAKQCQRLMPAAPAEADLDALVADDAFTLDHADDEVHSLRKFFGDNDATAKLFEDAIAIYKQRITDLRAQLADKDAVQGTFESYAQIVAEHSANITRLESENAEAQELLTNAVRLSSTLEGAELYSAINSFLAKQGDTPKEQARDWCTDADNCRRCKAFVQGELPHAGIPL